MEHLFVSEIQQLKVFDLPACAQLGLLFYDAGKLPGRLIPEVFVESWTRFLDAGWGFGYVLRSQESGELIGAIAGMVAADPNDGELQAAEMFWFVHPDARGGGLKLLRAWEEGAVELGAKRLAMTHLHELAPEKLGRLYERRGYRKLETNYILEV